MGFFSNIDRHAKIGRIIALGNAFKLPGLRRFLSQSLGYDIQRVESFRGLEGPEVIAAPSFKENILSFGVCYGLALQGLGKGGLKTNLLPKQIVRDRLIREKKPWAVAAAAAAVAGVQPELRRLLDGPVHARRGPLERRRVRATQITGRAADLKDRTDKAVKEFDGYKSIGDNLVGHVEKRVQWLELLKAINQALPVDDPKHDDIRERNQLHITSIDCQQVDDLSQWFAGVKQWYKPLSELPGGAPAQGGAPGPPGGQPGGPLPGGAPGGPESGPSGKGWVIAIHGRHYHNNKEGAAQSGEFVRNTLMQGLVSGKIEVPTMDGKTETVSLKDLGIGYPVLINPGRIETEVIDNPSPIIIGGESPGGLPQGRRETGREEDESRQETIRLNKFAFTMQFVWKPTLASERHAVKKENK